MKILLLHGAIGAAAQLEPLAAQLRSAGHETHLLNFEGHGGRRAEGSHFSIARFAENVMDYLDENDLDEVSVFGYSMGGYVGMYCMSLYPERFDCIATLATKWQWNEEISAREVAMLQPEKIKEKLPTFAKALAERHAPESWHGVLKLTANMLEAMGMRSPLTMEEMTFIKAPSLLLLGDKDKMVSVEETENAANALPYGEMEMLKDTSHPIEQVDVKLLSTRLDHWFSAKG